ncbi:hypothetical protein ABKN59_004528 [Abortiporus biennis]
MFSQNTLFSLVALFFAAQPALGQILINGQIFTGALSIVDSPAPQSTLHAGSTTGIAIDISGDGHLDQAASTPNSGLATSFDSLEIYLVSYETKLNLTVSQGPGLLTQETGSTVKHLNWLIDTCVPSGDYNLTFYEGSHIDKQPYFTITPLPIAIQNTQQSGDCSNGTNTLQSFPQAQSPPAHSPWLNGNETAVSFPSTTASSAITTLSIHIFAALISIISLSSLAF